MKAFDFPQYSPEWWEARRGVPTASGFDKIITAAKHLPSASMHDYIHELLGDLYRLDYPPAERPLSREMAHGVECEPEARSWYELERAVDVLQVGFCLADDGRFGCSPDGLVGEDGGLELKCPQPKTQIKYLVAGGLPAEYWPQVHGSLIVTGREWWDFLSYCPGLPPLLLRVTPDDYTRKLAEALEAFWVRFQEAKAVLAGREVFA